MNAEQIREEVRYRYQERLGLLCGDLDPTPEQISIARAEAEEWRREWLKSQNNQLTK